MCSPAEAHASPFNVLSSSPSHHQALLKSSKAMLQQHHSAFAYMSDQAYNSDNSDDEDDEDEDGGKLFSQPLAGGRLMTVG